MSAGNNNKRSLIPTQQKWDTKGDSVEGTLLSKEDTIYRENTRGRYLVQTGDGLVVYMGGFQIDQAMKLVVVGDKIGITYTGESEGSGGNKMKLFDIWIDDGVDDGTVDKAKTAAASKAAEAPKD